MLEAIFEAAFEVVIEVVGELVLGPTVDTVTNNLTEQAAGKGITKGKRGRGWIAFCTLTLVFAGMIWLGVFLIGQDSLGAAILIFLLASYFPGVIMYTIVKVRKKKER